MKFNGKAYGWILFLFLFVGILISACGNGNVATPSPQAIHFGGKICGPDIMQHMHVYQSVPAGQSEVPLGTITTYNCLNPDGSGNPTGLAQWQKDNTTVVSLLFPYQQGNSSDTALKMVDPNTKCAVDIPLSDGYTNSNGSKDVDVTANCPGHSSKSNQA